MNGRLLCVLLFTALAYQQCLGDGLLGNVLSGSNGQGGIGGILGHLLSGSNGNGLLAQLVSELTGNKCGLVSGLLGLCGPEPGEPCCRCCNGTDYGVNALCVKIGLLDLLFERPSSCPEGSVIACTAQACKVGQQCNIQAANLHCADVGK